MKYQVGDKVRVFGLNKVGTIVKIEKYEEVVKGVKRPFTSYKIEFEDKKHLWVKYNFEKVEE